MNTHIVDGWEPVSPEEPIQIVPQETLIIEPSPSPNTLVDGSYEMLLIWGAVILAIIGAVIIINKAKKDG